MSFRSLIGEGGRWNQSRTQRDETDCEVRGNGGGGGVGKGKRVKCVIKTRVCVYENVCFLKVIWRGTEER